MWVVVEKWNNNKQQSKNSKPKTLTKQPGLMSKHKSIIVSDAAPLEQYKWGNDCDAYVLVDEPELIVKLEQMPVGACELVHFHRHCQQFFYVLAGEASMEIDNDAIQLKQSEGVLIAPGAKHRICNHGTSTLRFVVTSQPAVGTDRIAV